MARDQAVHCTHDAGVFWPPTPLALHVRFLASAGLRCCGLRWNWHDVVVGLIAQLCVALARELHPVSSIMDSRAVVW